MSVTGSVVLVGRPNVGKSTLFNRLTRSTRSIVANFPGMTRDRIFGTVDFLESDEAGDIGSFELIDTGGFAHQDAGSFAPDSQSITSKDIWQLTKASIDESEVVVLMLDGRSGIHPDDHHLYRHLLTAKAKVICAVNKVEGETAEQTALEFYELGAEEILTISAEHNLGILELREKIEEHLIELSENVRSQRERIEKTTKLAIIGRPNAGKSSILNRLLGEERSLVSTEPGTTRDTIDSPLRYNGHDYTVIDTAGIRRKSKIKMIAEQLSIGRSLRAIDEADLVLLVISAEEKITVQDARLASLAIERCKPLLIVINKWDLIEDKETLTTREWELDIREALGSMAYVPIIFVSCEQNQRVHEILRYIERMRAQYERRVDTATTNRALETIIRDHTPVLIRSKNRRLKFYYATQVKAKPPTFVIKCNNSDDMVESYRRFLCNRLQKDLGFSTIPIRTYFRGKDKDKVRSSRP